MTKHKPLGQYFPKNYHETTLLALSSIMILLLLPNRLSLLPPFSEQRTPLSTSGHTHPVYSMTLSGAAASPTLIRYLLFIYI
jgi:hypothetical protein